MNNTMDIDRQEEAHREMNQLVQMLRSQPKLSLIDTPDDPRREAVGATLQQIQTQVGLLQRYFADSTFAFAALGLAYEALRLAWYAVMHEHDGGKLGAVEDALKWINGWVKR